MLIRRDLSTLSFLLLLFVGSIIWINFHSAFWYDMDMALNSYLAGLMWNEKTLIPDNWVFGNSFFVIESTNLAALFYGLTHQTTLSMSLASSLWLFIIAGTFRWCLKPFVSGKGLAAGMLCLLGGVIFGTSTASYTKGLQVLYTMASYYACYLEVLLLTLGAWMRLYADKKVHWLLWTLIILLNLAVGMHSLREMLILGIPLLVLSVLFFCIQKDNRNAIRRASLLALFVLIAEALGYLYIRRLDIPSSPNIGGVGFEFGFDTLVDNFINSTKNILRISGLAFIKDGIRFLPLFVCAACVAAAVVWALIDILRKKETSPFPVFIGFAWISILAVFGVGIFFFRTRDIYFFIYWLLAALSIAYLINRAKQRQQRWVVATICLIAAVNYGYNFIPDFVDYHRYSPELEETTQILIDEGYTTLYGDDCAVFAASSKDRIVATPFRIFETNGQEALLSVFPYNKDLSLYDTRHGGKAFICFSNFYLDKCDAASYEALQHSLSCMEPLKSFQWRNRQILLYTPQKGVRLFSAITE